MCWPIALRKGMTNIERAKDIAEMQETMDPRLLHKYGLLFPVLAERDYRAP